MGTSGYECLGFLLRLQSEAVELQAGTAADATSMSPSRHSGLWADSSGVMILRLQRRKHRPAGSLLRCSCVCSLVGANMCLPHRVGPWFSACEAGQRLLPTTPQWFLETLRKLLRALGVPYPEEVALKTFRAGKATALAAAGVSLGEILVAGEWCSRAFLTYMSEEAVDAAHF